MPSYYPYGNFQQPPQYQPQMVQPSQPQIQNGGFVSVRTEEEARNYPVRQGMSVTFKNETTPYIYTKTMGFSQLDRPMFEKYKLIKEDVPDDDMVPGEPSMIDKVNAEISALWEEVKALKEKSKYPINRKKDEGSV